MINTGNFHKLLKRQVKRYLGQNDSPSAEMERFLLAVSQAYNEFDDDLRRSELILDQSMKELFTANLELKKKAETKEAEAKNVGKLLETIAGSVSEIIFQIDNQNQFIYLNSAWERITGYSIEKSIGKKFSDFILQDEKETKKAVGKGRMLSEGGFSDVIKIQTNDDTVKWVRVTAGLTLDKNNLVVGASGTMVDVTNSYLVQQENNRLALVAQKTQNLVITTNVKGEIEWVNQAFTDVTGYELSEVIGKTPGSFLQGEETSEKTVKEIRDKLRKTKPYVGEIYNYSKDGFGYWIELSIDPIIENGEHLGFISVESVISERKEQEKEIVFHQQLLNETQFLANLGSWEYTMKEDHFVWSEGMYSILEVDNDESINLQYYLDRIHPEDVSKFLKAVEDAFNRGEENNVEHRIYTNSGKLKYLKGIGKPVKSRDGEYVSMRGSIQDVTLQKEFEQKLIKYQNDLDEAQLLSKIGSYEYNVSQKDIEWSKNAHAVFELSSSINLKKLDFSEYIHQEDLSSFEEVWNDCIQNRKPFALEYRISPRNGSTIYIEGSGQPIINGNKEVIKIVGTVQNITERKLAELEVKKNEEKYRGLLESMDLGILEVNNDGIIVNAFDKFCEMVGYTKEELIGKDPNEILIDITSIPKLQEETENRKEGRTGLYEMELVRKDKSRFWTMISGAPVYDKKGNVIGSLGIHMDMTERKKSEQKLKEYTSDLEKINAELDQFAYIVSHDLKAPLRAISNLSMWIEEDMDGKLSGETLEYFDLMRGRVQRMENLINGILDYSRAGRLKTKEEETDVNELLEKICDSQKVKDNIEYRLQKNLPVITTEKVALEQVFSNFISNGIKYNDKDLIIIEIGCKDLGDSCEFFVRDNGLGIDEAFHQKIFQIFQTLQARDEVESTGVGLAIVKKIIEEKGGEIRIDSSLGEGTTVYFTWKK